MNAFVYRLYSLRPAIEECWDKVRIGSFENVLAAKLLQANEDLEQLLSTTQNQGREFRETSLKRECERIVTAREFLASLFRIRLDEVDHRCDELPLKIGEVLDEAESALLRHIVRSVNAKASLLSHGGAYKLRMSGIISSRSNPDGSFPMTKKEARFTVENFETELAAAGVPNFYYAIPDEKNGYDLKELFDALPMCVKELFFSTSWKGKLRGDLPLHLLRDIFLYLDDEKWSQLKLLSEQGDKAQYQLQANKFVQEFLTLERELNGINFGVARRTRKQQKVSEDGKISFNPREQSLMELLQPYKWERKTRTTKENVDEGE